MVSRTTLRFWMMWPMLSSTWMMEKFCSCAPPLKRGGGMGGWACTDLAVEDQLVVLGGEHGLAMLLAVGEDDSNRRPVLVLPLQSELRDLRKRALSHKPQENVTASRKNCTACEPRL